MDDAAGRGTRDDWTEAIVAAVDEARDELVDLVLGLSNLPDLAGHERPVAEAVQAWFRANGIRAELQLLSATSANVLATVTARPSRNAAPGRSDAFLFSAHLDTEGGPPARQADHRRLRGAWQEGDLLIGKGLVNCKAQVAAQMLALRIVSRAGIPMAADLLFLGAAMETGGAVELPSAGPPDPTLGPHVNEGAGALAALGQGLRAGAALVGEPTGFGICSVEAGYVRVVIRVPGFIPYTPFINRGERPQDNPNSIERAARVITALEAWAIRYAARERTAYGEAIVAPRAQVQAVRSPRFLFTEDADPCEIFLDIRTLPGRDDGTIVAEIEASLEPLAMGCEVAVYDRQMGYRAEAAERLEAALSDAHLVVFGARPAPPAPEQTSMWHDTNAFNAAGIPAVSYGIAVQREPHTREKVRAALVTDLVRLAKVYALTAVSMCAALGDSAGQP
jgi:acetylornithine deacetylase/succinyl-diaminopimelate desuccinylase-like protein